MSQVPAEHAAKCENPYVRAALLAGLDLNHLCRECFLGVHDDRKHACTGTWELTPDERGPCQCGAPDPSQYAAVGWPALILPHPSARNARAWSDPDAAHRARAAVQALAAYCGLSFGAVAVAFNRVDRSDAPAPETES